MGRRGLDAAPRSSDSWTFDQFAAAAECVATGAATRAGVYIEPTLQGLSPFIYSGGGQVFDDAQGRPRSPSPTTTPQAALETDADVLRDPQVTPTHAAAGPSRRRSSCSRGASSAMIAGFRNLVPELRDAPDLDFDVMPMPDLDGPATVGDITGLCISADTEDARHAADFLVYVLSEEAVAQVASQGYLVPANVEVATSDDFLQPGRLPANAAVFNSSVRDIVSRRCSTRGTSSRPRSRPPSSAGDRARCSTRRRWTRSPRRSTRPPRRPQAALGQSEPSPG